MPYKSKAKQKEYQRQHFQKNKSSYSSSLSTRRIRNREYVESVRKSGRCVRCKETNYLVLDFHHVDTKTKVLDVREIAQAGGSLESIKKEIDKCNLTCRNCHRRHHWKKRRKAKTTQQQRRHEIADLVDDYKSKQACIRCKEKDFRVLDLHHKNPGSKYKNVSRMVTQGYGWSRILEEIKLCDVICSNCHAIVHNGK